MLIIGKIHNKVIENSGSILNEATAGRKYASFERFCNSLGIKRLREAGILMGGNDML